MRFEYAYLFLRRVHAFFFLKLKIVLSNSLTFKSSVCLRELSIRSLVVVVELTWIEWVRTRERIVNFGVFCLAGVEPILTLATALQTFNILFLI